MDVEKLIENATEKNLSCTSAQRNSVKITQKRKCVEAWQDVADEFGKGVSGLSSSIFKTHSSLVSSREACYRGIIYLTCIYKILLYVYYISTVRQEYSTVSLHYPLI